MSHEAKVLQTFQLTRIRPCQETHMDTEMPTLRARTHTSFKAFSEKKASGKNSPPESSSTQINHVSQESQGKSGITERGVHGGGKRPSRLLAP